MKSPSPVLNVTWRDLVPMTAFEKMYELTLSLPWLFASWWCYHRGFIVAGAFCSFYFFLTGLRQSHGAQHHSLGVGRPVQDAVLFALSLLMLASMHAVQVSHLHHHKLCLEESDTEGTTARLKWWQAIAIGPFFPIRLHRSAWNLGTVAKRRWIAAEIAGVTILLVAACQIASPALSWHVAAMLVGECFTGFFAVWTVHHDCDAHETLARTQRGEWINRLSYNMFFHLEHHLFPQVPTGHLHILAARLDAGANARPLARVI